MKKSLLTALAALSLFTLFGCNNRTETQTLIPAQAAELKPMQQSYRGVVPCADCEGTEILLFLEKDGTWVINQTDQASGVSFARYGKWARTADKLVLTDSDGEKQYFHPKGDSLVMLDSKGNPIDSPFNHTLDAVDSKLPSTAMPMKGQFQYMADAGVFQDCATGKTFAIADNAELERAYAAARGKNNAPVLLVVEGHFTLQVSRDSGQLQKVLVADKGVKFKPGKTCSD